MLSLDRFMAPVVGARPRALGQPVRSALCRCKYGGWHEDVSSKKKRTSSPSPSPDHVEWRPAVAMVACVSLLGGVLAGGGVRLAFGLVAGSMGAAAAIGGGLPSLVRDVERALERLRRRREHASSEEVAATIDEIEMLVTSMSGFEKSGQIQQALSSLRRLLQLESISSTRDPISGARDQHPPSTRMDDSSVDSIEVQKPPSPNPLATSDVNRGAEEVTVVHEASSSGDGGGGLEAPSKPSSGGDDWFTRRLKQAEELMDDGRQVTDPSKGNSLLVQARVLVEEAVRMKPRSLVALGMLANVLLAHGELKLKAAEKLREVLASVKSRQDWLEARSELEELQQLADGCEDLLLEAGRNYRKALTLRRDDVRALHNWGVALRLRARFISLEQDKDEGAAEDADKVYLAAIDKFEALAGMSSHEQAAAAALLNWAMTVRDRSRLRSKNSNERMKLLVHAKELLRDASRLSVPEQQTEVDTELSSCETELDELQTYQDSRRHLY